MIILKSSLVQIACSSSCSVVSHVLMVSVLHKEALCLLTISSADLGSCCLLHSSVDSPFLDLTEMELFCAWLVVGICFVVVLKRGSHWVAHSDLDLAVFLLLHFPPWRGGLGLWHSQCRACFFKLIHTVACNYTSYLKKIKSFFSCDKIDIILVILLSHPSCFLLCIT